MEWRREQGGWGSPIEVLYLGNWRVGSVQYDAATNKSDNKKYAAYSRMPGHKTPLAHYSSPEAGKERVEKAVKRWIQAAGLDFAKTEMRGD